MGMGPVMAGGSIAIILILAIETKRRSRWPVSIEHTAYSGYFFLYVEYNIDISYLGAPEPRGRAALVNMTRRAASAATAKTADHAMKHTYMQISADICGSVSRLTTSIFGENSPLLDLLWGTTINTNTLFPNFLCTSNSHAHLLSTEV